MFTNNDTTSRLRNIISRQVLHSCCCPNACSLFDVLSEVAGSLHRGLVWSSSSSICIEDIRVINIDHSSHTKTCIYQTSGSGDGITAIDVGQYQ